MVLELRKLETRDKASFLRAVALTAGNDRGFALYYRDDLGFGAYLRTLEDAERGLGLPEGHVPSTSLFGFVGAEIVGRLMLRHKLTDTLLRVGGHIGYVVVPEHRGRGYATAMLRQGLGAARSIGLEKVLVTCDEDNIASRRTIERCGGVYENSVTSAEGAVGKRRYWITLISA